MFEAWWKAHELEFVISGALWGIALLALVALWLADRISPK